MEAKIHPNAAARVYGILESGNVLESRAGDGVFVHSGAPRKCIHWRDTELIRDLERALDAAAEAGIDREFLERFVRTDSGRGLVLTDFEGRVLRVF
jgi:DNA-binding transcriptional regulator YhcF (GntR family)